VSERETSDAQRAEYARQRAEDLEKRLSRLRVELAAPGPGLSVTLDGRAVGAAGLGSLLPLDPGEHTIEATGPGKKPWRNRVELAPGPATLAVVVPPLENAPAAAVPPPALTPSLEPLSSQPDAVEPAPARPTLSRKTIGLIVGSFGLASLAVGGVLGALTFEKKRDIDEVCPANACPDMASLDRAGKLHEEAQSSARTSTISVAVGAAAVLGSAYLLFTANPSPASASTAALSPLLAPGALGVLALRRW
jgi:hypothetical protein